MAYSDIQMIIASQIAYIDFEHAAVLENLTVKEALEIELEGAGGKRREQIEKLLNRIEESPQSRECGSWVVKNICNNQDTSGMYACMIDTGDGGALVSFRGSESDTLDQKVKDWALSDFGLLNSVLTPQQGTAQRYMRRLYEKYGDQYSSFAATGHSLGGNLAEHAVITAPDGMRDKITQCVNLDGPGFSASYMAAHAADIAKSKDVIDHYQWSVVGTLLHPVPGTRYQTTKADTPKIGGFLKNLAFRHDTYSVTEFDENGNMVPGTKDPLAIGLDIPSKLLDLSLFGMVSFLGAAAYNLLDMAVDTIEGMWGAWKEWLTDGRNKDAQIQVRLSSIYREAEHMKRISSKIKQIQEEVEQIGRTLAFDSLSAGYTKYKLWCIGNTLEGNALKLEALAEAGNECARIYGNNEADIAGMYVSG